MATVKSALWIKEKNGKTWLSGNVEIEGVKHNITLFSNDYATPENKQPNWRSPKDDKPKDPASDTTFDGDKFTDPF